MSFETAMLQAPASVHFRLGCGVEDADAMGGDMKVSGQLTGGVAFEFERGGSFGQQPEIGGLEVIDSGDFVPITRENGERSLG